MTSSVQSHTLWQALAEDLRLRRKLVILPAVAATLLSLAYAVGRPDTWKASQSLLVRDETGGTLGRQGRFDSADAMKTAQETVVEVARNYAVVEAALRAVGPPLRRAETATWPTREQIELAQRAISVSPPKGAEFGRTEVIYLATAERGRERAIKLNQAVCRQLELRLQELRNSKAQSIIAELLKAVHGAQRDLDVATAELEALERQVGSDLAELRVLNELGSGEGNLRSSLNQIKNELRQLRTAHDASVQRLKLLDEAQRDPDRLLAAPTQWFEAQPALRRLKEGLADAGLRVAQLRGRMSADHPEVQAALAAQREVREQLQTELAGAAGAHAAELQVSTAQIESLSRQYADVDQRLKRLAGMRARYANLVAQTRQRGETLAKAQKDLADAKASQAAARASSLITRLDEPDAGDGPVGPSRATIVLGGLFGGLAGGLALVFLTAPLGNRGRRLSDYFRGGRRATDRTAKPASTAKPTDTAAGERRAAERRGTERLQPEFGEVIVDRR